jgi:hypothetical protein
MLHPDVFPGASATSHPLSSSPAGNPYYRSFVGSVYELYSAGGSLECRNVLSVGHEEIRRRIVDEGVDVTPSGSCFRDCSIAASVNEDFGLGANTYRSFGGGIPGLPGVQTINRDCTTLGCNIESTCEFLLNCFENNVDQLEHPFPIQADDPVAASGAYQCLKDFSEARRNVADEPAPGAEEEEEEQRGLMEFKPDQFAPAADLGPRVYESNTLTYQMFGFRGPLWMTQVCNDGSGCPFVKGARAFPSLMRSVLTEIYLCHACSCHKIEDGNARGRGGGRPGLDRRGHSGEAGVPRGGQHGQGRGAARLPAGTGSDQHREHARTHRAGADCRR